MKILKIGDFELPVLSSFDITQRYEPLGGESILRTVSGRGIKQMTWNKLRVTTSGNGWVPSGIDSLDFTIQHTLACIAQATVPADDDRQATLPANRRSDDLHVPYGLAQFANGQTLMVAVAMSGDLATVAETPGAVRYQVGYYPLLTCWINRPTRSGPDHSWEFVAEEV